MSMRGWVAGRAGPVARTASAGRSARAGRGARGEDPGRSEERGGGEIERLAEIFRTLADPTRLRLLLLLAEGEACVRDLCIGAGMSQPAVSHQLRLLRMGHLVRGRRAGREVHYALDDDHVMELIEQARSHARHPAVPSVAAGVAPRRARAEGTTPRRARRRRT